MTEHLPLAGLKIVVTRPREQATQLANGIEKLGGSCLLFPLLDITPLADVRALSEIAARLHEFQLAIFISPNAVKHGMAVIQSIGNLPASLQIATVGLSSAKMLNNDFGIQDIITPQHRFDSEGLLELPELLEISGKHVVIFRGDSGRELLGDTLKARGASVEYATCYHRGKPQHDLTGLLAADPDAISVSSSEALANLNGMFAASDREHFLALPLFVSHARIAAAAHSLGWRNIVTASGGGDGDLLSTLASWATLKKSRP